ncbi:MAG: MGDG synthase family glycosyltransferase, partial [Anaerolineae bacterium]
MTISTTEPLPRVTIMTAESGGGHRTAAQSLAEALQDKAQVMYLNLMDEHAPFPINTWSAMYGPWVTYTPGLYRLVYRFGADRRRVLWAARALYPYVKPSIARPLLEQDTDLFISVHPLHVDVPLWILRSAGRRTPFVT